jgi:arylsulfatase A-like enzyme
LPKIYKAPTKAKIYSKQSVGGNNTKDRSKYTNEDHERFRTKPNFLLITIDEARYPPGYESESIRKWRKESLLAQEFLRNNGMEFHRHYAGATACCPSRGTLYTGQYPSLHGVTQTSGPGKEPFSEDIFWLDPSSVPTMGDYFRAAGYRTFYKGKWHFSDEDILIPGTHNAFPSYNKLTGIPDTEKENIYMNADRLDDFGFSGWVGPEPHGINPRNSGSSAAIGLAGRDQVYASEVVNLIEVLDKEKKEDPNAIRGPWVIVSSFVNPHDIALFGELTHRNSSFKFEVDPTIPNIPPPPTLLELLETKPRCQRSYRDIYPLALQPTLNTNFYRQLYYQLQKNVDEQMQKVLQGLRDSSFYDDTIVIFTSDHGDLLGAHGGLHQKWYCAYEEAIHVPFIIHNPKLFSRPESVDLLTSHVDILPTMLGLAGIDMAEVQLLVRVDHTEVHPLAGKDLSALILKKGTFDRADEPLYFMTDDDPTRNSTQVGALGIPYDPVVQPNHIETVIAPILTDGVKMIWKYSRYFDNPQFWSDPGVKDEMMHQTPIRMEFGPHTGYVERSTCFTTVKTEPVPDEYELYNLTMDPFETANLADPNLSTVESREIQKKLAFLLKEQCRKKRLSPSSGTVPGMPSCEEL